MVRAFPFSSQDRNEQREHEISGFGGNCLSDADLKAY